MPYTSFFFEVSKNYFSSFSALIFYKMKIQLKTKVIMNRAMKRVEVKMPKTLGLKTETI